MLHAMLRCPREEVEGCVREKEGAVAVIILYTAHIRTHTHTRAHGRVELAAKTTTCCSLSSPLAAPHTLADPCRRWRPLHDNRFSEHQT